MLFTTWLLGQCLAKTAPIDWLWHALESFNKCICAFSQPIDCYLSSLTKSQYIIIKWQAHSNSADGIGRITYFWLENLTKTAAMLHSWLLECSTCIAVWWVWDVVFWGCRLTRRFTRSCISATFRLSKSGSSRRSMTLSLMQLAPSSVTVKVMRIRSIPEAASLRWASEANTPAVETSDSERDAVRDAISLSASKNSLPKTALSLPLHHTSHVCWPTLHSLRMVQITVFNLDKLALIVRSNKRTWPKSPGILYLAWTSLYSSIGCFTRSSQITITDIICKDEPVAIYRWRWWRSHVSRTGSTWMKGMSSLKSAFWAQDSFLWFGAGGYRESLQTIVAARQIWSGLEIALRLYLPHVYRSISLLWALVNSSELPDKMEARDGVLGDDPLTDLVPLMLLSLNPEVAEPGRDDAGLPANSLALTRIILPNEECKKLLE